MFNSLLAAGYDAGTAGSIANTPNWDQANNRFRSAMANPPRTSAAPPPPTPTPAPRVATDNNPRRLSPESDGTNLKIKKKSRKRSQELSKGTGQQRINPTQSANVSTAGQAAASGGQHLMGIARERYEALRGVRSQFLDVARAASHLTLPYLIKYDSDYTETHKRLITPWQSVGAKCVTALAAKLMLAVLPPQTTFFKLQVRDDKLGEEMDPTIRSELDLSFSKIERMIMDYINGQNDRVVIHAALKHLIVGGNALLFMGKEGMKNYPLNRFVVNRDGDGNILEIVTKELIARRVLAPDLPDGFFKDKINPVSNDTAGVINSTNDEGVEVYTYVRMNKQRTQWVWHQEVFDYILPGSRSTAPKDASPWIPLGIQRG